MRPLQKVQQAVKFFSLMVKRNGARRRDGLRFGGKMNPHG